MTARRIWLRRLAAAAAAIAIIAGAVWAARAFHESRLKALFRGPVVAVPSTPSARHGGLRWDLSEYAAAGMIPDNALDIAPGADVTTGATRLYRVCVPTAYRERAQSPVLSITEPVEGAVFPPNLCAPVVMWDDPVNDLWLVRVTLAERVLGEWLARERRFRLPRDAWGLVASAPEAPVRLEVLGVRRHTGSGVQATSVTLRVSSDPADEAIIYRLVDPPFINTKTPDTYVRELAREEPRVFIRSRGRYCINCHTFSGENGSMTPDGIKGPGPIFSMAIQVRHLGTEDRGPNTYLAFCDLTQGAVRRAVLPFAVQMTTFMSWSPDGTQLAFAANQDLASESPTLLEAQNTHQTESDLAVLDLKSWTVRLVPGASLPRVLETYPRWTPDGKRLVFSTGPPKRPEPLSPLALRIIPAEGGTAELLPNVPDDGAARFYPRFSPDGRWFTFVRSTGGSLIKPSSDLYIMPADFSTAPRALECNDPASTDSWYSWSSNSRWIVFTSKRDDGIFARLYFAHIDADGHASPPVRLPTSDEPMLSFNVPEFVARAPRLDEATLTRNLGVETKPLIVPAAGGPRD